MTTFPPGTDLLQLLYDRLNRIAPRSLEGHRPGGRRPAAGVLVALTDNPGGIA